MNVRLLVFTLGTVWTLPAQERVELIASAWRVHVAGTIQSGILPIDLQSDLALQDRYTFFGRLTVFPGERHGIVVEGSSLQMEGDNDLARTIVYNGRTYNVRDRILSSAELTTLYAGYQYNVLSARRGRLALGGGGAYVQAFGAIESVSTAAQASREHRVGLPLAAMDGRVNLLPDRDLLEVAGDLKGMSFGRYGRYVQAGVHFGINLGYFGFRVGYLMIDADLHEADGASAGVAPRLSGPAFSLVLRR
jgi:hypothetical protein